MRPWGETGLVKLVENLSHRADRPIYYHLLDLGSVVDERRLWVLTGEQSTQSTKVYLRITSIGIRVWSEIHHLDHGRDGNSRLHTETVIMVVHFHCKPHRFPLVNTSIIIKRKQCSYLEGCVVPLFSKCFGGASFEPAPIDSSDSTLGNKGYPHCGCITWWYGGTTNGPCWVSKALREIMLALGFLSEMAGTGRTTINACRNFDLSTDYLLPREYLDWLKRKKHPWPLETGWWIEDSKHYSPSNLALEMFKEDGSKVVIDASHPSGKSLLRWFS
jgi:hypothetical protein